MNIGRETAGDHSGGHMRHTYQKNSGKTKQENAGGNFWTPTANFDHGGRPSRPLVGGDANEHRLRDGGRSLRWPYAAHLPIFFKKNLAGEHGRRILGHQRHQRSNMTMAASHYGLRKEGKPSNIGWETAAD